MTIKPIPRVEEIIEEIKEMFRLNDESGGYNPDDISRIQYLLTEFSTSSYEQGRQDERELHLRREKDIMAILCPNCKQEYADFAEKKSL